MLKLAFFAVLVAFCSASAKLEELFIWNELPFAWPSEDVKNEAVKAGSYIPDHNLPLGLDVWDDKLFVTVPRWKGGVAASLGYIPLKGSNKSAPLIPYPSWEANTLPKDGETSRPDQIISTFRVSIDVCDRLWVMDTGLADILGDPKQISPPSIVIFNLKTNQLLHRYALKESDLKGHDSFFANIVVDVPKDSCEKAFAYIPDLGGYGLVVYSLSDDDSWRIKHNFFHFEPLQGDLTVGGVNFQWTDGIFGLALGAVEESGFRTVYFHALASIHEFSVNSQVLKNKTLATDPHSYDLFKLEGTKGEKTQTSASVFDEKSNVLFFTQLNKDGIACWNPRTKLIPDNVALVVEDHERLIFTNDLKIGKSDRNLYILSDRMPEFLYESLNSNETNYRIFKLPVDEAIKGTVCKA